MKRKKLSAKRIVAAAMSAVIVTGGIQAVSVEAKSETMLVSGKTVYINSSIGTNSASAYTGSDTSVTVKVKSTYISAKNGTLASPVSKSKNGGNIASVSFSAPSGAVSKSITSSHTASYNGAQVRDTTSASR